MDKIFHWILLDTRGTPGPSPGLIEAANFVAAHLQIFKENACTTFFHPVAEILSN